MMTDKEIIIKIKNGEINHFSFLVKKYTKTIFNYIKNKIGETEEAEDLTQNVFISFYKAIERFDEKKPVKPYLFQIVKNELKMFYRDHKNLLPLNEDIIFEEKDNIEFDRNFLNSLKNSEKEVLMMLIEGYSYKEIAKRFKKRLNTVKSIIRRARKKLLVIGY